MLAIFPKAFANPPEELNSPASEKASKKPNSLKTLSETSSLITLPTLSPLTLVNLLFLLMFNLTIPISHFMIRADQVVKGLDGSFAFVVHDSKGGSVFAALICRL
ncbi:hypothetical protein Q3G72_022868 [Acer saccharum]|nr:hypothetical protein Q3G72_022868 [Acer saccharum]